MSGLLKCSIKSQVSSFPEVNIFNYLIQYVESTKDRARETSISDTDNRNYKVLPFTKADGAKSTHLAIPSFQVQLLLNTYAVPVYPLFVFGAVMC